MMEANLRISRTQTTKPSTKELQDRVTSRAKELGVAAPTVNEIVRRRRAVTAEMALRFSRYFGTTAQLWQNLQAQYDLEIASRKIGEKVARAIQPLPRPDLSSSPVSS